MPLLSVLKAALRFNRSHGDRKDYQSPGFPPIQEAGLMVCKGCGTSILFNEATELFSCCTKCGELLERR